MRLISFLLRLSKELYNNVKHTSRGSSISSSDEVIQIFKMPKPNRSKSVKALRRGQRMESRVHIWGTKAK